MKKLIILFLSIIFISCNSSSEKPKENIESKINAIDTLNISLGDFEKITLVDSDTLTDAIRQKLQIENIEDLSGYSNHYLYKGKTIIENNQGSIVSLFVYSEGEASEYLISYNASGNYVSNVIVGYEDWVEGYSKTSSKIVNGKLTIETLNFDYSEDVEKTDTIFENYKINPDLTFIKD